MIGPLLVICTSDAPAVEGSLAVKCVRCGDPVWISPASAAQPGASPICYPCVEPILEADANPIILGPTAGQLDEIAEVERRRRLWRRR